MKNTIALGVVALLCVTFTAPALAEQTDEERIRALMADWKHGEGLYNDYDYEGALAVLEPALAGMGNLPESSRQAFKAELIEGHRYLAYSAIALEQYDKAAAAFVAILELDPAFDPGEVSPKIRAVFDKAAAKVPGTAPIRIEHDPVKTFRAGEPITIRATIRPAPESATVFYRTAWWGPLKELRMLDVDNGIYVAVIPGRATAHAKKIAYYIAAKGSDESHSARLGSEKEPLVIEESSGRSGDGEPEIPEESPHGDL